MQLAEAKTLFDAGVLLGVVSRNRRNFRHASSTPATRVSRSITLLSL